MKASTESRISEPDEADYGEEEQVAAAEPDAPSEAPPEDAQPEQEQQDAGRELEENYDKQIRELKVDLERVDYWLSTGAQPSDTVASLIKRARTAAFCGMGLVGSLILVATTVAIIQFVRV